MESVVMDIDTEEVTVPWVIIDEVDPFLSASGQ